MRASESMVLVTGGAGYIGSHAVLALKDAGWSVVVIDNLTTGFREAVPSDLPFYEGDVGDGALIRRIIAKHNVMAIMHFAGSVVVPESIINPLKYYDNNTARSRSLIEAAVLSDVPHFIFSSSAAVYGDSSDFHVREECPANPINPYGMSKLMTEAMLADAAKAHPINFCALRYFNVAGADPDGRAGQSTAGAQHLIKIAIEAALGKREFVSVFGNDYDTPDGTGIRDYIHVTDLVQAHVQILKLLIAHPRQSMVLNCGYGKGFSVLDVLNAVSRNSGNVIERRIAPRRLGDPAAVVANSERLRAMIHWRPQYDDIDLIIRHALAWETQLASRV